MAYAQPPESGIVLTKILFGRALETALHNDPSSSEDEDDEDQKEKKKVISKFIDECVEIYFNMEVESDADDYDKDDSDDSEELDYDGDQEESTSSNKVVFL